MYGYHFVFITKYRKKLISPAIEIKLYSFMRSKSKQLGLTVIAINGLADHVHLYVQSQEILDTSKVAAILKGSSSHYIRRNFPKLNFIEHFWSKSYHVAPVFTGKDKALVCYIQRQKNTANLDRVFLP